MLTCDPSPFDPIVHPHVTIVFKYQCLSGKLWLETGIVWYIPSMVDLPIRRYTGNSSFFLVTGCKNDNLSIPIQSAPCLNYSQGQSLIIQKWICKEYSKLNIPIDLSMARKMLHLYANDELKDKIPLVIFTLNNQCAMLLNFDPLSDSTGFQVMDMLNTGQFDHENNTLGWDFLLKKAKDEWGEQVGLSCRVHVVYTLLSEPIVLSDSDEDASSVKLSFQWESQKAELLSKNIPNHSTMILDMKHCSGLWDTLNYKIASPFRTQLEKLSKLDTVRTMGNVEDLLNDSFEPCLVEQVHSWLDTLQDTSLDQRPDMDFVEKLWLFLQNASELKDIQETLKIIFNSLIKGVLMPYIHRQNQSGLAKMIRDVLKLHRSNIGLEEQEQQRESIKGLVEYWETTGLAEFLIEMGLYYLKRFTQSHLTSDELLSLGHLDYFADAGLPLEEQLTRLKGMLRILEIWELIKVNVPGLPKDRFRSILLTSLTHVKEWIENEHDLDQTFFIQLHLPLTSNDLIKMKTTITESFDPVFYQVEMISKNRSIFVALDKEDSLMAEQEFSEELLESQGYCMMNGRKDMFIKKS